MVDVIPIRSIFLSGLFGEVVFEFYAWIISPLVFGFSLQPSRLVIAIVERISGVALGYPVAFLIHALIGILVFAIVVWAVQRFSSWSFFLSGLASGVFLWFVAQGILAPFVGRSFMMDFGPYTQSSFVAHVGMAVAIALVMQRLMHRPSATVQLSARQSDTAV